MSGRLRDVAVAGLSLVLAVVLVYGRLLPAGYDPRVPGVGDLLAYYYPMLAYGFAELRSGRLPLWNPYQACGTPFFAIPQIGILYPLYLPFLLLPSDQAVVFDMVVHLVVAALGAYALCRHFGFGRPAATLGALVYAFQGAMVVDLYFANFLVGAAWMPWIFLLVDRGLTEGSWRAAGWLGAAFGTSLLGGMLQFTYYTACGLVPLVLWRAGWLARREGVARVLRNAAVVAAGVGLAFLVAAVRLVPAQEYIADSWRPPGILSEAQSAAIFVARNKLLGTFVEPAMQPGMRIGLLGIVPLALACVGVILWRPRGLALVVAAVGIGAALYATGLQSVVYRVMFALPGGNWFRGLDRVLVLVGLAVALLAAAATDAVFRRAPDAMPARGVVAAVCFVAVAAAMLAGVGGDGPGSRAAVACAAVGLLAGGTRFGWLRGAGMLALGVVAVGPLLAGQWPIGALPPRVQRPSPFEEVFADLRARQGLSRTYIVAGFERRHLLPFASDLAKAGMQHGLWLPTDYEALTGSRAFGYLWLLGRGMPVGYTHFILKRSNIQLFELMGVRFVVLEPGAADTIIGGRLRRQRGWRVVRHLPLLVFEAPHALPRAFVTPRVETVRRASRVLKRLRKADLRAVGFVEVERPRPAPAGAGTPGDADIVEYTPNRVTIETRAPDGGLLVLTDQYAPGWKAAVDGNPAEVERADYLYRGVMVPPGRHQVVMTYRPASFVLGALASSLGLALVVLLVRRP